MPGQLWAKSRRVPEGKWSLVTAPCPARGAPQTPSDRTGLVVNASGCRAGQHGTCAQTLSLMYRHELFKICLCVHGLVCPASTAHLAVHCFTDGAWL